MKMAWYKGSLLTFKYCKHYFIYIYFSLYIQVWSKNKHFIFWWKNKTLKNYWQRERSKHSENWYPKTFQLRDILLSNFNAFFVSNIIIGFLRVTGFIFMLEFAYFLCIYPAAWLFWIKNFHILLNWLLSIEWKSYCI